MAEGGTDIGYCVAETFDNLVKFFGTAAGAYGEEKAKTERQRNGFDSHTAGDWVGGWCIVWKRAHCRFS